MLHLNLKFMVILATLMTLVYPPGWASEASLLLLTGYAGQVYERTATGAISTTIPGVNLTFVKEDGSQTYNTTTDSSGSYRLPLPPGRYWVRATHNSYEDYTSVPGFFVVFGTQFQVGNIFLNAPKVTTLLLVRHADRTAGDDLTPAGQQRAYQLADVARKAGVTAIYSTNTIRTKKTATPLADRLKLGINFYGNGTQLISQVFPEHIGDVVLVVGHSDTIAGLANQLGAAVDAYTNFSDFDNVLFVTRKVNALTANSVNLQYGLPSLEGSASASAYQMTTVLIVRDSEGGDRGIRRADHLVETLRKAPLRSVPAGSTRLLTSGLPASTQILQPLASAFGLPLQSYNADDLNDLVSQIRSQPQGTLIVLAANATTTQQLVTQLGGKPTPIVLPTEYDDLLVLTLEPSTQAKVVNLQYGEPSPSPNLVFRGTEAYTANGQSWTRYKLAIANSLYLPADLFIVAPDLPPCGLNPNASRTWVDIYNATTNRRLYGFCALTSLTDLGSLWFAIAKGTPSPKQVYVVLTDRRTNTAYRSNTITIP